MTGRTVAITGSASGMGAALASRFEQEGVRVVGIDQHRAEVMADLGTPNGRRSAISAVASITQRLEGVAAFAGVSGHGGLPGSVVVSVDYFGAVALLQGLRPLLAQSAGAAAVAIGSIGAVVHPGVSVELVDACLEHDEQRARAIADAVGPPAAYVAAKLALGRWVRRNAPTGAWIRSGITLNLVAPGLVQTPMVDQARTEAAGQDVVAGFAVPAGRAGQPEEIASVVAFLLGPEARFMSGSIITIDGGSEAESVPDAWPAARSGAQT